MKSFFRTCGKVEVAEFDDIQQVVFSKIHKRHVKREHEISIREENDDNFATATITGKKEEQLVALLKVEDDDTKKLWALFDNLKKWNKLSLIPLIGITFLTSKESFYLIYDWHADLRPIATLSHQLSEADAQKRLCMLLNIVSTVKEILKSRLVTNPTCLDQDNIFTDSDLNIFVLVNEFGKRRSHSLLVTNEDESLSWNVGVIMSLINGNDELTIPFGDYQNVEAIVEDFINCNPKEKVKYSYLNREMNRILDALKVTGTQRNWRKFKKSRKMTIKFNESPLL